MGKEGGEKPSTYSFTKLNQHLLGVFLYVCIHIFFIIDGKWIQKNKDVDLNNKNYSFQYIYRLIRVIRSTYWLLEVQ